MWHYQGQATMLQHSYKVEKILIQKDYTSKPSFHGYLHQSAGPAEAAGKWVHNLHFCP